jgi:hypothetical protein
LVAELTKQLMSVRRDLLGEQPLLAGIAAPDTDSDAFSAVHPGAACDPKTVRHKRKRRS